MKKTLFIIIVLISFIGFSQTKTKEIRRTKTFTSLKNYKRLFGNNLSKIDSLNFIFKENDTLIPLPKSYKKPESFSVPYKAKDSIFLEFYKEIVYKKHSNTITEKSKKLTMKYWKNTIKIYFSKSVDKTVKKELKKFANNLSSEIDSLKITFVNKLEKSNYLIYGFNSESTYKFEPRLKGNKNIYYISWDKNQRIYDCKLQLNSDLYKNKEELIFNSKKLFLQSLGHFNLTYMLPRDNFFSSLSSKKKKFNPLDLELLKYHYSYGICKGTNLETFEKQHEIAKKTFERTGRNIYFLHSNK